MENDELIENPVNGVERLYKQYADKLSSRQRPGFRSQEAEAVNERRGDCDNEKIEDERLAGAKPRRNEGQPGEDERPHHSAGDGLQSVSLEKVRCGKRETVDRDRHEDERQRGHGGGHGADPDRADARPRRGAVGHRLQDLEAAARHRNKPELHLQVPHKLNFPSMYRVRSMNSDRRLAKS